MLILLTKDTYLMWQWLIMFKHNILVIVGIVTSYKTNILLKLKECISDSADGSTREV